MWNMTPVLMQASSPSNNDIVFVISTFFMLCIPIGALIILVKNEMFVSRVRDINRHVVLDVTYDEENNRFIEHTRDYYIRSGQAGRPGGLVPRDPDDPVGFIETIKDLIKMFNDFYQWEWGPTILFFFGIFILSFFIKDIILYIIYLLTPIKLSIPAYVNTSPFIIYKNFTLEHLLYFIWFWVLLWFAYILIREFKPEWYSTIIKILNKYFPIFLLIEKISDIWVRKKK